MKLLMNILLRTHNLLYTLINSLAVRIHGEHPKHKIIEYHKFFMENIEKDSLVADVGCADGYISKHVAKKAKKVVAIDIDTRRIEKQKLPKNIEVIKADVTKLKINKTFDTIILSNVLEHIKNREEFLKKIKPKTKKILVRVPMIDRDWLVIYKKNMGVDYRLDPTHYTEYTLEQFKKETKAAGLELINYNIKFGELYAILK